MVDESIVNIVKKYIKELESKGLSFYKVILYGSHAKGTADEDSDIDVLLISNLFDEDKDKYIQTVWMTDIGTDNRIEPYMMGEKRFMTGWSPLIDAAKYEGVEVV